VLNNANPRRVGIAAVPGSINPHNPAQTSVSAANTTADDVDVEPLAPTVESPQLSDPGHEIIRAATCDLGKPGAWDSDTVCRFEPQVGAAEERVPLGTCCVTPAILACQCMQANNVTLRHRIL
jgi:hypothetical protein